MAHSQYTILESWPGLKEDLIDFLSDTDAWVIAELKEASKTRDWARIENLIDVMNSVHNLSHSD
jgi:hypothetical protein